MAIHGNSFRFLPFHSPNVYINQLHRHIQNIIPEKSGRQVVDGGRHAAHPLQLTQPLRPHRRGGCCVVGGRQRRQQLRPDASGSRPRAHCTGSGGGASSRMAAELRRIVSHQITTSPQQMHPATGRRCESAAARMVGGGTHFVRGRDSPPPVLPSQSRSTSQDDRPASSGSKWSHRPQTTPPTCCLPL